MHSFVVTPAGFGDLMVYQSVGGRIFGYGDVTVNSQGERETKLVLVRGPFAVADTIRDIMGKPIVRVEGTRLKHAVAVCCPLGNRLHYIPML